MSIQAKLRSVAKQKNRLAKVEQALRDEAKAQKLLAGQVKTFVNTSGLAARDLVFAIVDLFGVRLAGRRKGSTRRRKRTKITAELRDAVRKRVKSGASMNKTAKEFDLSYAVVAKMIKGHYEKLK
jgi:hypothetical protein